MDVTDLSGFIEKVGFPIAVAFLLASGIYLIVSHLLNSLTGKIDGITLIQSQLAKRIKTMNAEVIRLEVMIDEELDIPSDIDRVGRADEHESRHD